MVGVVLGSFVYEEITAMDSTLPPWLSGVVILVGMLLIYFVPALIAFYRGHRQLGWFLIANFMVGWTLVGWVICLVSAFAARPEKKERLAQMAKQRPEDQLLKNWFWVALSLGFFISAPMVVAEIMAVDSGDLVTRRWDGYETTFLNTPAASYAFLISLYLFEAGLVAVPWLVWMMHAVGATDDKRHTEMKSRALKPWAMSAAICFVLGAVLMTIYVALR